MSEIRFFENENGLVITGISPILKHRIIKIINQLEYLSPAFILSFIKKPFKKNKYGDITNQDLFEFIELLNNDTSLIDKVLMKIKKSKQIVASIDE